MPNAPLVYGEMVQVTNESDKDFKDSFASKEYFIRAGQTAICPLDAVWLWCGYGEVRDEPENGRFYRVQEVARLRARYGAYNNDDTWERNRPRLKAAQFDGTEIVTVIDDPEGAHLKEAASMDDFTALKAQYESMQREMDAMRKVITSRDNAESGKSENVTEDKPRTIPGGQKKRAAQ